MSTQTAPTPPSAHPPAPQPRPDGAHDDRNDARAPVSEAAAAATHDADRGASAGGGGGEDPSGAPSGAPYPPQTHAGKAGLGPHYYEQHRATLQDKVHGLREVLEGHIKHDEQLQQQGHNRVTGELKEQQRKEEEEKSSPFHKAGK